MFAIRILILLSLLETVHLNQIYHPRNIPHDNLEDDMNNVRNEEYYDWDGGGDLDWEEVFRDEYEEKKRSEQMEADLEAVGGSVEGSLDVVDGWPHKPLSIGQVGGLAVDSKGLLHILHRAGRRWGSRTFDRDNKYTENRTKIQENTVLVVNGSDGRVVKEWGNNLFSLPHGLAIDQHDDIYITDVALHQVFKFKAGQHDPVISLGRAYSPAASNNDRSLFCQPTDVAAASNGDFFVADGYCNSRIMKYSGGRLVGVFGQGDSDLPHSLALVEDADLLCVADREGMRVLCYKAGLKGGSVLGEPVNQFFHPRIGPVFALAYNHDDSLIYGVAGKVGVLRAIGFTLDVKNSPLYSSDFVALWSPSHYIHGDDGEEEEDDEGGDEDDEEEFQNPHAIASRGESVYVGETGPNVVWKFKKGR